MTATDEKITDLKVILNSGKEVIVPVYRAGLSGCRVYVEYGKLYGYIGKKINKEKALIVLTNMVKKIKLAETMTFRDILSWNTNPKYVFFLGNKRTLTNNILFKDNPDFFYIAPKAKFVPVFDEICAQYVKKRVLEEAKRGHIELQPNFKIRIGNFRSKQASFRKKDFLFEFDRRLFAFKPIVIDAIVDHELSHVNHMNHQKGFYELLYSLCPETRYNTCIKIINEGKFEYVPTKNY